MSRLAVCLLLVWCASCAVEPDTYVSFTDRVRQEDMSAQGALAAAAGTGIGNGAQPSSAEGPFFDDGSFASGGSHRARKVVIGRQVWAGISSPPGSRYRFPVRLGPGSVLEFGHTCVRDAASPRDRRRRLTGSVRLVTPTSRTTLFSLDWGCRSARPRHVRFERWRFGSAPPVRAWLEFATDAVGSPGERPSGTPIWIAPHVYRKVAAPRHVVLVSLDTVRRDYLDVYGNRPSLTPHLARLAQDAVVFENAFSQSTWTLPAHASLLTGLNPAAHQATGFQSWLPRDAPFLPVLLRQRGYLTTAFTGGGPLSRDFGFSRGFDLYEVADADSEPDSAGQVFERARQFVAANGGKPFFLFLHTMQAHDPLESPHQIVSRFFPGRPSLTRKLVLERLVGWRNKYRPLPAPLQRDIRDHYRAEVKTLDEHLIGPLLRLLEEQGLYEQTLLVVTSDHGEELYDHGGWQHGHSVYNEIVRVPLLVKLPGAAFAGRRVTANVRLIDVLPTVLESTGADAAAGIDGVSLLPLLRGEERAERVCVSDYVPMAERPWLPRRIAITHGRYKLVSNGPAQVSRGYLDYPAPQRPDLELYDLLEDPGERRNLAATEVVPLRALSAMLREYRRRERPVERRANPDAETTQMLRDLGYLQ